MRHVARAPFATALFLVTAGLMAAAPAFTLTPKEPSDQLDLLVTIDPSLRVVEVNVDATTYNGPLPTFQATEDFRAAYGEAWRFTVDLRRGVTSLLDGGAIPFIPGVANDLAWENFAPGCSSYDCLPVATVEALARDFIDANSDALGLGSADLVLDPAGSGPFGDHLYFLRFDWTADGLPVDHASVYVRINSGNLIQLATERVGPAVLDVQPTFTAADARAILEDYLGPFGGANDQVIDEGSLRIVPVTPAGQDPDVFDGVIGSGIDYRLAWRIAFIRKDVIGTWEGVIDAHTGVLLRFVDTNRYGRIHGGAYPGDNHTGEADRPFPFADTGLPSPNQYANSGGLFPGDNATSHLQGKYVRINDSCGSISNTTITGDVDFSLGSGTDCAVPTGNTGGAGNTHSARTQFYHLTAANLRAQAWLPGNTWLQSSYITVNTNQSPWCNATSGGASLNFYKAASGCWNLGEIPGVALHEWGHSLDNYDGSGGQSTPVETYADWMAALHLHDSCVGRGFLLSGNCGGYGDPCTSCTGIRDIDYTRHTHNTPWTAANYGTVWSGCSGGSYFGPCNLEDHCEAGIAAQALWDFVNRKLAAPPHNLDARTAWLLGDRLWYLVIPTLGVDMYTCTVPSSNGCGGSSLFTVMKAIDDDGDGTANGTPHAGAIFSAMNDHNIACGAASDPTNQNQSLCPTLGAPTVTGEGQNNSALLSWTAVTSASRYAIYRSDIGCDAGLLRIATVDAAAVTYTDTTVVNDIDYYYMVQALGTTDDCFGPVSNCEVVTPVPCFSPDPPTGLSAAAAGANQISLSWSSSDPGADSFSVYRAVGTCPQPSYELIASGVTATSYLDSTVSGGITYSYVVTATDVTGGCESSSSNCSQAQTTGTCVEPPAFAGLQSVTNAALSTCTLDLAWNPATAYCGGPATYSVYRSTTPGFTPGPANRIASNLAGTTFTDAADLSYGTIYYYVVRATDGSTGVQDDNLVEVSSSPTGPIDIGTWTDNAGDTGTAQLVPTTPWSVATTGGHNGPKVYATGTYTDNLCSPLTSNEMHLGTGPALTFWSKYSLESGWDKGEVQVSTNGGTTWVRVPVNYPGSSTYTSDACDLPTGTYFTGTNNSYAQYSASLATWANQDIMIRWLLSTDTSITSTGWWVDDITITNVEVPSSCTSNPSPYPGAFGKSAPANGATNQPTDGLTLSWNASASATSFEVCVDTVNNSVCDTSWNPVGAGLSTVINGLDESTTYSWQVRAVNTFGSTEADGGTWWAFTTEGLPMPGAFSKTAPANGATNQPTNPTLSWGASTDATSYEYCFDTSNNATCNASWVSVGTATSAALSGLATGTTYSWQVRAVNGQGNTQANSGTWWTFITQPMPGVFSKTAPANGATGQPTSLSLTWGTSADATSYEYCFDTSSNSTCNASWVNVGNVTSAALSGLVAGTTYSWQVRAVNTQGNTDANGGTWWTFTTQPLPGAFSKTAPANGATNQPISLTLTWGTSSDATSYEYCSDTTNNGACDATWTSTGLVTSANLSGLAYAATYSWQVRAINGQGTTQANGGTWWTFTTEDQPLPGAFGKIAPADSATGQLTTLTLSWGASAGATSYEYCIDTVDNNACDSSWTAVGLVTSTQVTGLTEWTTYFWQVRAVNGGGATDADGGSWWWFITTPYLFFDGFESGDLTPWSNTVP